MISVVVLVTMLAIGGHIAVIILAMAYTASIDGGVAYVLPAFPDIVWQQSKDFLLIVIPLFVMMGEVIAKSGIADRMYRALSSLTRRLPGGLMHTNIAASALVAASCGSTTACAAAVGVPAFAQMRKRRYPQRLFLGSLAAGGTLGILIPPSMNMILYGVITNTSIPKLFLGGIVPGILLALSFMVIVGAISLLWPSDYDRGTNAPIRLRAFAGDLLPPLAVVFAVMGSIYAGLATITESAALGVVAATIVGMIFGRITASHWLEIVKGTITVSCMIYLILVASFVLNFVSASLGIGKHMESLLTLFGDGSGAMVFMVVVIFMVLGAVIDAMPLVVLAVSVVAAPLFQAGIDPIWFGVFVVLLSEIAILTPPVGVLCFVVQGVRCEGSISDVFIGVVPFIAVLFLFLFLVYLVPEIVTWLPHHS